MSATDVLTVTLLVAGSFFFLAGTVGLLRFPDTWSRLHALTKADNLGLGFIVAGLVLQAGSTMAVLKLALVWALGLVASATSCYLIAGHVGREHGRSAER
jgi:multicomponent Na+:H+ antiporter subunit G